MENKAGYEPFIKAYTSVKDHILKVRSERKRKRAVEKIVDPVAAADRKRRKNLGKKYGKKRKIANFRRNEGRSGAPKRRKHMDL